MKKLFLITAIMLLAMSIAFAQSSTGSAAGTNGRGTTATTSQTGQNSNSSAATTDQTGTTNQSGATAGQTGTTNQTDATAGQTGTTNQTDATAGQTGTTGTSSNGQRLPQTATPLPLLAMLGFGAVAAGVLTRRRKTARQN